MLLAYWRKLLVPKPLLDQRDGHCSSSLCLWRLAASGEGTAANISRSPEDPERRDILIRFDQQRADKVKLLKPNLNVAFGWWWADPVGALAMLPVILRQGWETLWEAREGDGADDDD